MIVGIVLLALSFRVRSSGRGQWAGGQRRVGIKGLSSPGNPSAASPVAWLTGRASPNEEQSCRTDFRGCVRGGQARQGAGGSRVLLVGGQSRQDQG